MKKSDASKLKISDFHYILPEEKIAKYPLVQRNMSKLLLYDNGEISTSNFSEIPSIIPPNSLMIFNNTRVIHARLLFRKPTGAVIEVFCLTPNQPQDYQLNFQQRKKCLWNCMIGNAKRWKEDVLSLTVNMDGTDVVMKARKISRNETDALVEFSWDNDGFTFSDLLEVAGKLPIPPYLNRESEEKDDETYQTVYSVIEGSVAAPTAGLHFTDEVMGLLHENRIKTDYVTLHVGAGTFKPVKSESIGEHEMHTEFISVSRDTIQSLFDNCNNLIVVGTTSLRTIESLYYIGKKIIDNPDVPENQLFVSQWEPYEEDVEIHPKKALKAIIDYFDRNKMGQLYAKTQIIIVPGYKFHYPQAIITNFHQPESTLLLLVSAFVGSDWERIYEYALHNDYRFLSYGDSSLLWRNGNLKI